VRISKDKIAGYKILTFSAEASRAKHKFAVKRNSWPKTRGVAMNPVDHVRISDRSLHFEKTNNIFSLTVVVTTSISVRPRLSPATPPRVKRPVSSPPEGQVFSVVPRRLRSRCEHEGMEFERASISQLQSQWPREHDHPTVSLYFSCSMWHDSEPIRRQKCAFSATIFKVQRSHCGVVDVVSGYAACVFMLDCLEGDPLIVDTPIFYSTTFVWSSRRTSATSRPHGTLNISICWSYCLSQDSFTSVPFLVLWSYIMLSPEPTSKSRRKNPSGSIVPFVLHIKQSHDVKDWPSC